MMPDTRPAAPSQMHNAHEQPDSARRLWELALDIAASGHDLNNLLTIAYGNLQMAMDSGLTGAGDLRLSAQAMEQAIALLRELMHKAPRHDTGGACDIPVLVQNVLLLSKPIWNDIPHLLITTEIQPMPLAAIPMLDLRRVLLNLVINAVAAMHRGGCLNIRAWAAGDRILLVVSDTGTGMNKEILARAFEPFSSTRPDSTGLGLAGSRLLVERVGGRIEIESTPGTGANVTIILPQLS
jgi:two-component system, cell cycle sensor histidine kinase and response regulator CckA